MPTVNLGSTDPDVLSYIGPTIDVQIGFDPSYRASSGSQPILPPTLWPALIDTGAMDSCIDSELASILHLTAVNRRWIAGVSGPQEVNVYAAQLLIPSLNSVIHGTFHGINLRAGGQPHLALIGRTFLRSYKLVYDGRIGVVTLSND